MNKIKKLVFDENKFLTEGMVENVACGYSEEDAKIILSEPSSIEETGHGAIWCYGALEFHFLAQETSDVKTLYTIFCDQIDCFFSRVTQKYVEVKPCYSILTQNINLPTAISLIKKHKLSAKIEYSPSLEAVYIIMPHGHTELLFEIPYQPNKDMTFPHKDIINCEQLELVAFYTRQGPFIHTDRIVVDDI